MRTEREIREEVGALQRMLVWTRYTARARRAAARLKVLLWVLGESPDPPGQRLLASFRDFERAEAEEGRMPGPVRDRPAQGAAQDQTPNGGA